MRVYGKAGGDPSYGSQFGMAKCHFRLAPKFKQPAATNSTMSDHLAKKQVDPTDERLDLRKPLPTVEYLHAQGQAMGERVPREWHGQWRRDEKREDILSIIKRSNAGRQERLIPLRMERMAASPFAFLRGAVAVMAWDLAHAPSTGLNVVIDGDCHINNF